MASFLLVAPFVVFGPRAATVLRFEYAYWSIDNGMSFDEVETVMRGFRRDDQIHAFLGVEPVPDAAIWLCDLGGTNDFNRIQVRFRDGKVVSKELLWEECLYSWSG